MTTSENPSGPDGEWTLTLDEQWDTFNRDIWGIGFGGSGLTAVSDDATVREDHVIVENNRCKLLVSSDGTGKDGVYQGVLNTADDDNEWNPNEGFTIDPKPGQYVEARMKMPGRTGVLPAFWSMSNSHTWPPEIDFVELFQFGNDEALERQTLHANAHWTSTGVPGDMDNHEQNPYSMNTGTDLTETFNTYGCAWFEDRVEWYFNGTHVVTRESPAEMLETLSHQDACPFFMMFSNHVNRLGDADLDTAWEAEMVIDWVRVWEFAGESQTDDSTGQTETTVLDDFDGGAFADGWHSTGSWETTTDVSGHGSHSATVTDKWSRLTWNGSPRFARGTTLQFDFAFDSSTDQQLNCAFGDSTTDADNSYRLDISRDGISVLNTDGWQWLGGDGAYQNGTVGELYTAEIELRDGQISIVVDGETTGEVSVLDSTYNGDIVHFEIEKGGAYIDEVRLIE
ncbi:rhizobiocin/RTX toxin and hemolysin-type calcium binding protein [Haloterrigena salina JCM 13891]|uniref:Rhizobiocin/RTX toxin and hemolysin-type calcium binding protein n=1 Tax=Haloterrigena salina JCM 13891 TaxID=1227488 RepID=M0CR90_9EURY|nr:family 16 glycosylhydrolase [Haloterrigena salina]ELZ24394.1 rhizobiocin/RTX toxin and hemolysin-type calcium binding protein [Haloterrigena salina JCM 13891]